MITKEEALNIVLNNTPVLPLEYIPLMQSHNRILAKEVLAQSDYPDYNRSQMDGYAIIQGDDSPSFKIKGIIKAGTYKEMEIQKGECVKIMTGGVLPHPANQVIPIENAREENHCMIIEHMPNKSFVRLKAEDLKKGDVLLASPLPIKDVEIGLLATAGISSVPVYCKPRTAIIATGDEVVEYTDYPQTGQIRNSNSPSLMLMVHHSNSNGIYLGIAKDHLEDIMEKLEAGIQIADVVIITGGVSVGDYDFVKEAVEKIQAEILFHKVSIKPGKPFLFAKKNNTLIFGCPGNPVSCKVIFEIFIKPALFQMQNYPFADTLIKAQLSQDLILKVPEDRDYFMPVRVQYNGGDYPVVYPIEYHGSAHLNAFLGANGMIMFKRNTTQKHKGDMVDVRPI